MLPAGIISSGVSLSAVAGFAAAGLAVGVAVAAGIAGTGLGVAGAAPGAAGNAGTAAVPLAGLLVLAETGNWRRVGVWRVGVFWAQSSKPVKNKIRTKAVVFILPLRLRVSNWLRAHLSRR